MAFFIRSLLSPQRKKQYERASEEAENSHHALEKADVDPNSTKAKIDKVCVCHSKVLNLSRGRVS